MDARVTSETEGEIAYLHVVGRDEGIVDSDNLDVWVVLGRANNHATNAAETVDTDANRGGHI